MNADATVLLESADPAVVEAFRIALAEEPELRLIVAPNGPDAAGPEEGTIIVVIDPAAGGGWPHSSRVPDGRPGATLPPLVLRLERESGVRAATPAGFDDTLTWPSSPREAHARLAALIRHHRTRKRLARVEAELGSLLESPMRADTPVMEVLRAVVETGLKGATERADRIASLARGIAARFEIPVELLDDLDHAARLHELGLLGSGTDARPPRPGLPVAAAWRYAARTRSILARHPALEGAAGLIASLYENWDGTGQPGHFLQGQIPLRARILRVLVDFTAILEGPAPPAPDVVLDLLEEHAGTLYDPMVIVHLRGWLEDTAERQHGDSSSMVTIADLEPGMVLAEDLCTDSGLKLLACRTVLTAGAIEIIRRRHQLEPIDRGAAIRRSAAA